MTAVACLLIMILSCIPDSSEDENVISYVSHAEHTCLTIDELAARIGATRAQVRAAIPELRAHYDIKEGPDGMISFVEKTRIKMRSDHSPHR